MLIQRLILGCRARKWRKAAGAEVPTICVGNITVGGTGKTPHTELILDMLQRSPKWGNCNLAVLSRGYKRHSKGFQQVMRSSSADFAGDEPLQIKKKFPAVTVAVDKDRIEGCRFLVHPDALQQKSRATKKVKDKTFPPSDLIILDDAFQYHKLHADLNIVLMDYNRPIAKDSLLPFGRLRDLKSRVKDADILVVTKCPSDLTAEERQVYIDTALEPLVPKGTPLHFVSLRPLPSFPASSLRDNLSPTGPSPCPSPGVEMPFGDHGSTADNNTPVYFTTIGYSKPEAVFEGAETRYSYSQNLVLFTGIANDDPLRAYLSDHYKIVEHLRFPDHHAYTKMDIAKIADAVKRNPTAVLMTTEKDAQRVLDSKKLPDIIKQRLFYVPIKVNFLSEEERAAFEQAITL